MTQDLGFLHTVHPQEDIGTVPFPRVSGQTNNPSSIGPAPSRVGCLVSLVHLVLPGRQNRIT